MQADFLQSPVRYQEVSGEKYELVISGLNGGHSGAEIDKNRANSNKLIGQALFTLEQDIPFCLTALEGGTKDNAIPRLQQRNFRMTGERNIPEPMKALP